MSPPCGFVDGTQRLRDWEPILTDLASEGRVGEGFVKNVSVFMWRSGTAWVGSSVKIRHNVYCATNI